MPVCNKSKNCSVSTSKESTGWKAGVWLVILHKLLQGGQLKVWGESERNQRENSQNLRNQRGKSQHKKISYAWPKSGSDTCISKPLRIVPGS